MRRYRIQARIDALQAKLVTLKGEERKEALGQLMPLLEQLRHTKAGRKE